VRPRDMGSRLTAAGLVTGVGTDKTIPRVPNHTTRPGGDAGCVFSLSPPVLKSVPR